MIAKSKLERVKLYVNTGRGDVNSEVSAVWSPQDHLLNVVSYCRTEFFVIKHVVKHF